MAALAGELCAGISIGGINQTSLSGVKLEHYEKSWGYAHYHKPLDLKTLEDNLFNSSKRVFNQFLQHSKDKGATFKGMFTFDFSVNILQMRQLNEKRYQDEFVNTGLISKVHEALNDDNRHWFFSDQKFISEALTLTIPDQMQMRNKPSNEAVRVFIENFLQNHSRLKPAEISGVLNDLDFHLENYGSQIFRKSIVDAIKRGDLRALDDEFLEGRLPGLLYIARMWDEQIVDDAMKGIILNRIEILLYFLQKIKDRFRAATTGSVIPFSEAELKEMMSLKSLPIIFASTKNIPIEDKYGDEKPCWRALKLGNDIDLMVTTKEARPILQQFLKRNNLHQKIRTCNIDQLKRVVQNTRSRP